MPVLPAAWQPYAKSVTPFILTIIAVVGQWAATGEFDRAELVTALVGIAGSAVSYVVPNGAAIESHHGEPPDTPDPILPRG